MLRFPAPLDSQAVLFTYAVWWSPRAKGTEVGEKVAGLQDSGSMAGRIASLYGAFELSVPQFPALKNAGLY